MTRHAAAARARAPFPQPVVAVSNPLSSISQVPVVEELEKSRKPGRVGRFVTIGAKPRLAEIQIIDEASLKNDMTGNKFWEVRGTGFLYHCELACTMVDRGVLNACLSLVRVSFQQPPQMGQAAREKREAEIARAVADANPALPDVSYKDKQPQLAASAEESLAYRVQVEDMDVARGAGGRGRKRKAKHKHKRKHEHNHEDEGQPQTKRLIAFTGSTATRPFYLGVVLKRKHDPSRAFKVRRAALACQTQAPATQLPV